jgi:hypothetical protein
MHGAAYSFPGNTPKKNKDMRKTVLTLSVFTFASLWLGSCHYDNYQNMHPTPKAPTVCDSSKVISFAKDVEPIFAASCLTGCHSSSSGSGGITLDTWNGVRRPASNGQLLQSIDHSQADGASNVFWMPLPSPNKLSACQIGIVKKWVNAGYLNN